MYVTIKQTSKSMSNIQMFCRKMIGTFYELKIAQKALMFFLRQSPQNSSQSIVHYICMMKIIFVNYAQRLFCQMIPSSFRCPKFSKCVHTCLWVCMCLRICCTKANLYNHQFFFFLETISFNTLHLYLSKRCHRLSKKELSAES